MENIIKKICTKCHAVIEELDDTMLNESEELIYCDNCKEQVSFFIERIEKHKTLLKD